MRNTFWAAVMVVVGLASGCGGDGGADACTEGEHQCDGDVSQVCTDGAWVDEEDCVAEDMGTCSAETGECDMGTM